MNTPFEAEGEKVDGEVHYQKKPELIELYNETDTCLKQLDGDLQGLWKLNHELFELGAFVETGELNEDGTAEKKFQSTHNEDDGLYSDIDPAYNTHIFGEDLGVRKGGRLEYDKLSENYDGKHDDETLNEREYIYRQRILQIGQKYGFVAKSSGKSTSQYDQFYTVGESEFEPLEAPVEAIVVLGAAGKSNVARIYDAIRNIESGAIKTSKIILAGCDRPSRENEHTSVQLFNTVAGDTEIQSMMYAFRDIITQDERALTIEGFDETKTEWDKTPYGKNLFAATWRSKVLISGVEIEVIAVSAPFDPERVEREKGLPRANTDETMYAAVAVLTEPGGTVVIQSHDTWGAAQGVAAQRVLGLEAGKKTILSCAYYDDRVVDTARGTDIRAAGQVIDEIQKLHRNYTLLRTKISTKIDAIEVESK